MEKNINESIDKVKELAVVVQKALYNELEEKKHYTYFEVISALSHVINSTAKKGLHDYENVKRKES